MSIIDMVDYLENAVKALQRFYDLNDDGIVDLVTFEAIRNEYDKNR